MPPIILNGNKLDPHADSEALWTLNVVSLNASTSNYILIQTKSPLSPKQKQDLNGAVVLERVAERTYLCRYDANEVELLASRDFVTWSSVYPTCFVVPAKLKQKPGDEVHGLHALAGSFKTSVQRELDVLLHRDLGTTEVIKAKLADAAHVDAGVIVDAKSKYRLRMQERYLDDVAKIDEVYAIAEVVPMETHNDQARIVMAATSPFSVSGGGRFAFEGKGEVIGVGDTGFDTGDAAHCHAAFGDRVLRLYDMGRGSADDPNGHGTHVCGSVLGDGMVAGARVQGTAPRANLVVQSWFDGHDLAGRASLARIPANFNDIFDGPFRDDGVRVHTNSWGVPNPGNEYTVHAREVDEFAFKHPEMVILFSAGNSGVDRFPTPPDGRVDLGQIGAQAAAKNCITVGASENFRRDLEITYGRLNATSFPRPPITDDLYADNPNGMAAFSSRGDELVKGESIRIKPDIVAPGTGILSTRSSAIEAASGIAMNINRFGPAPDPAWLYLAGTSMATPLTAGCCAILRESLIRDPTTGRRRPEVHPSSALIKALLINGAVELRGQYQMTEAGVSPNPSSGWGRVNLANSIIVEDPNNPPDGGFIEGTVPEGKTVTTRIPVPRGNPPGGDNQGSDTDDAQRPLAPSAGWTFKITLVWTDPPGPLVDNLHAVLQNHLNLIVKYGAREQHGNRAEGDAAFDQANNVEQVIMSGLDAGDVDHIDISIQGEDFAVGNEQAWAYAWRFS
jgi:serine protease AprX